jgi:lipopolysaccharide/colanic/teichoic acid biosynthesis glycosyltransferase
VTTADEPRSWLPFARPHRPHLVAQRAHRDRSLSPPLRLLSAIHCGAVGPTAILTDVVVLLAGCLLVLGAAGWSMAVLVSLGLCLSGRVYRDRDRVVARGLAWWPGVLVGPVAVGVLADDLLTDHESPMRAAAAAVVELTGLLLLRVLAWCVIASRRRNGRDLAVALVVGSGERAGTLARTLDRHREIGLRVGADVDPSLLSDPHLLAAAALQHGARHIFLVPTEGIPSPPALRRALGVPVHVSYVPLVSDALLSTRPQGRVGGVAVLPLGQPLRGPSGMRGKRLFDVVIAGPLLLLSAPLLLLAALAVRLDDGGPVFYRQSRTGQDGQRFLMTKFRTMRVGADTDQARLTSYNTSDGLLFKMTDDPRVTRVGHLLRRTGADELPQLLDVMRGRMSLVGPRPLPVESDAFSERDNERHLVRPGMTGLWQVSGGSSLRYREMIDLDLAYVHGWTLWIDVQVLLSTLGVLLRATVNRDGHAS